MTLMNVSFLLKMCHIWWVNMPYIILLNQRLPIYEQWSSNRIQTLYHKPYYQTITFYYFSHPISKHRTSDFPFFPYKFSSFHVVEYKMLSLNNNIIIQDWFSNLEDDFYKHNNIFSIMRWLVDICIQTGYIYKIYRNRKSLTELSYIQLFLKIFFDTSRMHFVTVCMWLRF